jgi:hypothetical protein
MLIFALYTMNILLSCEISIRRLLFATSSTFWLAYNTARAAGSLVQPLASVRAYILGLSETPSRLALFLEIVSPSLVASPNEAGGTRKVMPTDLYRSALTKFLKSGGERVLTRLVAVNSFYFHLMLPGEEISDGDFESIAEDFRQSLNGAVRLLPNEDKAIVTSSPQDALRSLTPHLKANADQYRKYFAKKGKKPDG